MTINTPTLPLSEAEASAEAEEKGRRRQKTSLAYPAHAWAIIHPCCHAMVETVAMSEDHAWELFTSVPRDKPNFRSRVDKAKANGFEAEQVVIEPRGAIRYDLALRVRMVEVCDWYESSAPDVHGFPGGAYEFFYDLVKGDTP